jgi:hypothetical protein
MVANGATLPDQKPLVGRVKKHRLRSFASNIAICRSLSNNNLSFSIPKERVPILIKKKYLSDAKAIEVISRTERWQIIDTRIELFRTAINVAKHDIDNAWQPYFNLVLPVMPTEVPGHPERSTLPWTLPDDQTAKQIDKLGEALLDAVSNLQCHIYDFQLEMQNLLLGRLFKNKLLARKPIDPNLIVVQLNRHTELTEFFEKQSAWGKSKIRIENEVRNSIKQ